MKKKELVDMVGYYSVHWWTGERIVFFISLPVVLLASYANIVHVFLPALTGLIVMMGFIFGILLCGLASLLAGKKISEIPLHVKELDKKLKTAKVLGKDGKEHTIGINFMEADRDASLTWVMVSGRLKELRTRLIIGPNISKIWKKG